jgi:hypothetical protein
MVLPIHGSMPASYSNFTCVRCGTGYYDTLKLARRRNLDGSGTSDPRSQHCGDQLVRLTYRQGRLSGAVAFARASVPIRNLVLLPDGSFSGATRARLTGSKLGRSYIVSGKFGGDTVSLTLEGDGCPLATASQLDRRQMAESGRGGSRFADHAQMVSRSDGPRVKAVAYRTRIALHQTPNPSARSQSRGGYTCRSGVGLAFVRSGSHRRSVALICHLPAGQKQNGATAGGGG